MVKVIFLNSGLVLVTEEQMNHGRKVWKKPLQLSYEGTKIQFKNLFHYTKENDLFPINPDIMMESEAVDALANHYNNAVEKFSAAKAGIVVFSDTPPPPSLIQPRRGN